MISGGSQGDAGSAGVDRADPRPDEDAVAGQMPSGSVPREEEEEEGIITRGRTPGDDAVSGESGEGRPGWPEREGGDGGGAGDDSASSTSSFSRDGEDDSESDSFFDDDGVASVVLTDDRFGHDKAKGLSTCEFLSLAIALGFVQIGFGLTSGLLVVYTTPYFESQSLPQSLISLNWLAGPISTIVTGLPLSLLSDHCFVPFFGRRRPWLGLSALLAGIGLIVLPNAHVIGGGPGKLATKIIAIAGFWTMTFGANWNIFSKALIVDTVPAKNQLAAVNIVLTIFSTLGSFTAFSLGAVPWARFVPHVRVNIEMVFLIALPIMLTATAITVWCVRERRDAMEMNEEEEKKGEDGEERGEGGEAEEEGGEQKQEYEGEKAFWEVDGVEPTEDSPLLVATAGGSINVVVGDREEEFGASKRNCCLSCLSTLRPLGKLPCVFWSTWVVQFLTYMEKYFGYIYMATFVGTSVFHGNPNAPVGSAPRRLFEDGVQFCSFALVIAAVTGVLYALVLTPLARCRVPVKLLWFVGLGLLGISFIIGGIFPNKILVCVVCVFYGIAQTTMVSIPWSVVNVAIRQMKDLHESRSFVQNVFNVSTMLPLVFVGSLGGLIVDLFTKVFKVKFQYIFCLAGGIGVIAAFAVLFVRFPKNFKL